MKNNGRYLPGLINCLLFTLLICLGFGGHGLASTPELPLVLEEDRLTGHLSQVTLRAVLDHLHQKLGIIYEAPAGELDTVISVDLQQTPILPALAKILAPWDYAFTMSGGGRLQYLYITKKAPPSKIDLQQMKQSDNLASDSSSGIRGGVPNQSDHTLGGDTTDHSQDFDPERLQQPFSSSQLSSSEAVTGLRSPVTAAPMAIQPVPPGTTMPIAPASGGSGMQVKPLTSNPNMPIIPATSYPPMDIQPVPDYLKEEMLRNIQP